MEDLDNFEKRDETRILEESLNLSEGQKARIALARALYSEKPIMLLNDPLTYFDPKIGQKIVDNLVKICEEEGKTIVMSAHNTYFVKSVHRIMVIHNKNIT